MDWLRKTHFCASAEAGISFIWMYTDVKFPGYPIDKKAYTEIYTEKGIERLKEAGINGICAYLGDFGYPPEKNREVIETCTRFTKLCKQAGFKTILYLQPSNIVSDPYYKELPESRSWGAVSKEGSQMPYVGFSGRHMVCLNNVGWHEHLKRIIINALNEVNPDGLFFDNFWHPECFCPICRERFKEYLSGKEEYELKKFGIDTEKIEPPLYEDFRDPLYREWVEFQHQTLLNFMHMLRKTIDEVKPGLPFTTNSWGQGFAMFRWHDLSRVSKIEDFVFIEIDTAPRIQEYNLVNSIRSFKYVKACTDKPILSYAHVPGSVTPRQSIPTQEQTKLSIAEAAACGVNSTFNITERFTDRWTILSAEEFKLQRSAAREYYEFLDKNWDYYDKAESAANVAVLRSKYIEWTWKETFPHVFGFEQALMQTQVPFDIVMSHGITTEMLARYNVLVIANLPILPDEEVKTITKFVNNGGGLVLTGHPIIYNERYEFRGDYGLKELLGVSYPHNSEVRREYGKGRVIFLPDGPSRIDMFNVAASNVKHMDYQHSDPILVNENILVDVYRAGGHAQGLRSFKMLPEQFKRIREAVRWASNDTLPVEFAGQYKYVCIELMKQPQKDRLIVHLLNYDFLEPVKNLRLYLRIPTGKDVKKSLLISPEMEVLRELEVGLEQNRKTFTIPLLKMYDLLVVELK